MGLDMYLEKRTYVKNWEHMGADEKTKITVKGKRAANIKPERITYITEEIAYWRKANQIHAWFVNNCNGGDDNNGEMQVSFEQLQELLETCKKVMASIKLVKGKIENGQRATAKGWEPIMEDGEYIEDASVAKELLPTQSGFFFGSTQYDQYYVEDLKHTIETLERLMSEGENIHADYYYSASW